MNPPADTHRTRSTVRERTPSHQYAWRSAAVRLALGVAAVVTVFGLGLVATLGVVHAAQLSFDRQVAADRVSGLTRVADVLTALASPEIVGVGALVLIPVLLFVNRRRVDGVRALCVMGGALALAFVTKFLIAEPRPPQSLWALPADSGNAYPSGHTTVAAAIIVALLVVARTGIARAVLAVAGGAYVIAVAVSRVYVSNHYPLDVAGSVLAAIAAGFVVAGLSRIPAVEHRTSRWDRAPQRTASDATR